MNICFLLPRKMHLSVALLLGLGASLSQAQPANDLFANRIGISGTNIVVTGINVSATREAGEPYHAGYSGGLSVWWTWVAPFAGTVTMSTAGSSFDTLLGVYTGNSVSALTEIASNDQDGGLDTSKVSFDTVSNQTYQIAVDGWNAQSGSITLSVQLGPIQPPPPAPSWALPDPYGVMDYSSNYAGKVIIFDFWATWCGPCKAEIPDFIHLQDKYRNDGLVIIGASVDSTSQVVVDFMATNVPAPNYPLIMANYALRQAYGGISAIPATFIIDRQNIIRKQYVGTQSQSTFERQIIPLLYANTKLGCRRSGNQMVLSWRTNALAFTLESATHPAGAWSTWPTTPAVVNGTNTVAVPTTGAPRYFRLRMPY
jgi:thiol-disulfide isomerase/thioredoxin